MNILLVLTGIAGGGFTYFVIAWVLSRKEYRKMSYIEIRNAQISEDLKILRKDGYKKKFNKRLDDLGYQGNILPVVLMVTFLYLIIAIILSLFGLSQLVGLFLALPISLFTSLALAGYAEAKKEALFKRQLLQVVSLVVTSLDNADNPVNAFSKAAMSVGDPLQKEFTAAFASMITAEDSISSVLKPLAEKYPSRAFDLIMAALAVDDKVGAKLGAPLRQAQYALEREFELVSEANAEISQARSEFYGITVVIGLISIVLLTGSNGSATEAYTSPIGIISLTFLISNYVFGIFRTLKIFQRAKRGY